MSQNYKLAKNLSLLYVIYMLTCLFIDIRIFESLFLIIAFPIILFSLKKLLKIRYGYNIDKVVNIAIFIIIISIIIPIAGSVILSTMVDISTLSGNQVGDKIIFPSNIPHLNIILGIGKFMVFPMIARGLMFVVLSIYLIRKIKNFRIGLKITVGLLFLWGIQTIVIGIVTLFPNILFIFSRQGTLMSINIVKYLVQYITIPLFVSLFLEFKEGNIIKDDGEALETCE